MNARATTPIARILGHEWLIPILDDHNRDYFTRGVLVVQACRACEAAQHPPEDVCRSCGSADLSARECTGTGRIESVAVVHHAVHPALAERVPYVVVLVALDDAPGVRLVGNLDAADDRPAMIGARVQVVFEQVLEPESGRDLWIPQWRLVD